MINRQRELDLNTTPGRKSSKRKEVRHITKGMTGIVKVRMGVQISGHTRREEQFDWDFRGRGTYKDGTIRFIWMERH
jgi:hypothetical protein